MSERPAGKGTRTQQHEIVIDAPVESRVEGDHAMARS